MVLVRTVGADTVGVATAVTAMVGTEATVVVGVAMSTGVALARAVASGEATATGVETGALSAEAEVIPEIREIAMDATTVIASIQAGYPIVVVVLFMDGPTAPLPFPVVTT
jgi:hypothetical protein